MSRSFRTHLETVRKMAPIERPFPTLEQWQQWTKDKAEEWGPYLIPYVGQPARFMEIGVCTGQTSYWLMGHVLTHPNASMVGVEPFPRPGALNLPTTFPGRYELRKGLSPAIPNEYPPESFDAIHVDGNHDYDFVLADCVAAWRLLKIGGILFADDYAWTFPKENTDSNQRRAMSISKAQTYVPREVRPAVDDFLRLHAKETAEILYRGYTIGIRKKG